jgi:hypothetical protein
VLQVKAQLEKDKARKDEADLDVAQICAAGLQVADMKHGIDTQRSEKSRILRNDLERVLTKGDLS